MAHVRHELLHPLSRRRDSCRDRGRPWHLGLASLWPTLGSLARHGRSIRSAPEGPHFAPKAKRLIHLFMHGGPSQVDTFDHKPDIAKYAGQRPAEVDRQDARENTKNGLFPSPFGFRQYGQCGQVGERYFPNVGQRVDDICFIRSMHTDIPEHAGAA